jgi:hypothetical protein
MTVMIHSHLASVGIVSINVKRRNVNQTKNAKKENVKPELNLIDHYSLLFINNIYTKKYL